MKSQNTITITKTDLDKILSEINSLKRSISELVDLVKDRLDLEPLYGSKEWWKWSEKKADNDIKRGLVHGPFKNANELVNSLHLESKSL